MKNELTQAQVQELFEYRDGELYWKKFPGHSAMQIGDRAGSVSIDINKKSYLTNIDPLDNKIENLRECTMAENNRNRKKGKPTTTSRFKGVCWDKVRNKWKTKIVVNSKNINLGYFTDEWAAALAYNNAAKEYHKEFACYNNNSKRE